MIVARTHGLKSRRGPYTAQTGSPLIAGLFDNVGHFASLLDIRSLKGGAREKKGDTYHFFTQLPVILSSIFDKLLANAWLLMCPRSHT